MDGCVPHAPQARVTAEVIQIAGKLEAVADAFEYGQDPSVGEVNDLITQIDALRHQITAHRR